MNYEQACKRVDELEAIVKAREAHDKLTECGCGDIRPAAEFCHICGKCQMGCCMCGERIDSLTQQLADNAALLEEARKTIEALSVAAKWGEL